VRSTWTGQQIERKSSNFSSIGAEKVHWDYRHGTDWLTDWLNTNQPIGSCHTYHISILHVCVKDSMCDGFHVCTHTRSWQKEDHRVEIETHISHHVNTRSNIFRHEKETTQFTHVVYENNNMYSFFSLKNRCTWDPRIDKCVCECQEKENMSFCFHWDLYSTLLCQ